MSKVGVEILLLLVGVFGVSAINPFLPVGVKL